MIIFPSATLDFALDSILIYSLDVMHLGTNDDLLNGLLNGLKLSFLDDLRFGKIGNNLTILIDNKLDIY